MAPAHRPPRQTDFARVPDSTPIVIDNGASTFRIGWAGEAEPRVAFRNTVQRPRHRSSAGETVTVVGDADPALMKYFDCTRTMIRSPFDDDVVYQFEYMEYILDYGFDRLSATSELTKTDGSCLDIVVEKIVSNMTANLTRSDADPVAGAQGLGKKIKKMPIFSSPLKAL